MTVGVDGRPSRLVVSADPNQLRQVVLQPAVQRPGRPAARRARSACGRRRPTRPADRIDPDGRRTPGRGCRPTWATGSSSRSSAPRSPGWGWGCRSAGGSSRRTAGRYPGGRPARRRGGVHRPAPAARRAPAGRAERAVTDAELEIPMPKLLIIDDEPNVLYSLQAGLETDDLAVVTAQTARQGLAAGRRENGRTWSSSTSACRTCPGWSVFDRIREIDPRLPVIVITAFAADRDGHRGDEARGVRVPAQAGRPAPAAGGGRPGGRAAADAERAGRVRRRAGRRPAADQIVGRSPGDAGGVQGDRPGRPAGRDRADPRRERHRQGTGRPGHLPALASGPTSRSWRSTARPSRRRCWRASCSATRRARSPGPTGSGSASSSRPTAARCSSTRSAT